LLQFLQLLQSDGHTISSSKGIRKATLLAQPAVSRSSMETLKKNGVLLEYEEITPRFKFLQESVNEFQPITLTPEQQQVSLQIQSYFESGSFFLLHGVTGSGKTAVYIDLIQQALLNGTQVLYLLPEIALTSQIVRRLHQYFGSSMGIYHSRFSDNERVEVWNGILDGKLNFIVGVRSAIFLPFDHLGLVILDEEHDPSFKQHEPAPRYAGNESALQLARLHHAKVLMGTATPSLEAWYHAQKTSYGYAKLTQRYGDARLPSIELIDLKKARQMDKLKGEFSQRLIDALRETVDRDRQAILFQNRRGYAPTMHCITCGHTIQCDNCSVSLTYHKFRELLQCHYCGFHEPVPTGCPACGSTHLELSGFGTEKLEETLQALLPEVRITRMDQDTTRGKYRFEQILSDFEDGKTQVLIGTQMVTKGLDFEKVALVGVLDADRMLYYPDFRSLERSFQLLNQVSGRAGRSVDPGKVLIQTWKPDHWIFKTLEPNNSISFYEQEIQDRQHFGYPPFTRIIELIIKHEDKPTAKKASYTLSEMLWQRVGRHRVLGPVEPMISRIRNQFLFSVVIKLERKGLDLKEAKRRIMSSIDELSKEKDFRSVRIIVDVDPR
jgi:primosomal protein N' (replication factor Y)